jgi:hypothetical protein
MREEETEERMYLYAVIADTGQRTFKTRGIGERGDVVETICYRRLAAVVSASQVELYENSRRNMMAHTQVLEEVMTEFDLLPVRFGTVANSRTVIIEELLMPRYDELTELLEQMRGRIELGLKIFWREDTVFAEIARDNENIRMLKEGLQGRSLEETYYERIKLGEAVDTALRQMHVREEERILSILRPLAIKSRSNKIFGDRMILNAAFLVSRENEKAIDEAVQALERDEGGRLLFKYVGPVPPYNFVNIVVNWKDKKWVSSASC